MPVLINIAANLLFGAGMATVSRDSPSFRDRLFNWSLLSAFAFIALVITPVATYTFRFYPHWSVLYFFDPQVFPGFEYWIDGLSFLAILGNFGAALLGYALTRYGYLQEVRWVSLICFPVGALSILAVAAFHFDRVAFVGDYDGFWQGQAEWFFLKAPGLVGPAAYLAALAFTLWINARFSGRDPQVL